MRVTVIGAGIGGLALAQALRRADIDVVVHDRDAHVGATGGYRLALDRPACETLCEALGPEHYQALLGSSAPPSASRVLTLADHRLRVLAEQTFDPADEALFIGRVPLRALLAEGLGERLRFGSSYRDHEVRPDGRVVTYFEDGDSEVSDVLVGADGVRSRVTANLAGRPTSTPCDYGCIAARIPLTAAVRRRLPALLAGGPGLAQGPGGLGLFLTAHDPAAGATVDPATCREVAAITEPPALVWGLIGPEALLRPTRSSGPPLAAQDPVAHSLIVLRGWAPDLRDLLTATDPTSAAYFGYHTCDPDSDLTPWPAGAVTALGDAVHAMPPTGGGSAATAVRDAGHLATELVAARDGTTTIPLATLRFQQTMTGYAPSRVRDALGLLHSMQRLSHPLASGAARIGFPTLAAWHRVRTSLTGTGRTSAAVAGPSQVVS
ncbi:NAD(P)/FAD-dependent oxidoreductase [Actinomycetospora corticicola]|uniref:2-polyprenyl-6-methoxyphenol hydroxylase-like FAD-dependent oxidoreductase n=1 Tax=Actinomycetospora corticicola TaxID=663602 RepID=A0A7Y9DY21_9PSEU|nr:NAD(P)/FAD-dependent oxidoreductase [Actinomycetospora corticicola]NYD37560.1 2-polyprenyl-6-methoxyphenol hydroxylase-like FAD-dependent oxidoreductase [Actinomycetospora corticicola]